MVIKKAFRNSAACVIGGKAPDERFLLAVEDDGVTPSETFWRKRVADGSVVFDAPDAAAPDKAKAKAKASATPADKGTA